MLEPKRAPVRPRVVSPLTGETLLLEDEILSLVESSRSDTIWVRGGIGYGKSIAIEHLAAVLPASAKIDLVEDDDLEVLPRGSFTVRFAVPGAVPKDAAAVYSLAGWGDDEVLEYLCSVHRERCSSVLRRWGPKDEVARLGGTPGICRQVLDCLARDDGIPSIREGLAKVVDELLPAGEVRDKAEGWCLGLLGSQLQLTIDCEEALKKMCEFQPLKRLLFVHAVMLFLAMDRIVNELRKDGPCEFLRFSLDSKLISEVGGVIRNDRVALDRLDCILASRGAIDQQAMAASLMLAANSDWRPHVKTVRVAGSWLRRRKIVIPNLSGARLNGAKWTRIALCKMDLRKADLSDADLSNATLDHGDAHRVNLAGARLTGASLVAFRGTSANLSGADLSYLRAPKCSFDQAVAEGASFEGALLKESSFLQANLSGSNFTRSNLSGAKLVDAEIEGADFSQAELTGARLTGLKLRLAEFRQCRFHKAQMLACDLEGMILPGVDFQQANLTGALLTGTVMPHADFRGAKLVNAGLAEIDWEQADLREADLRGASFHMGSSRSGLVDSPIASYGSRTGFYTDDYNEQDFKSPEEIRKANLRGADLRGANIEGVDFYLVDLRDAQYDAAQEQHFRGCGAILESRVQ
jgi:uncharacterized protein YjbI with pentapeptide repeats